MTVSLGVFVFAESSDLRLGYVGPRCGYGLWANRGCRVLAIEGQFLYLPGCMIISFDDTQTHTTEVKIVRVPQGVNLGKLRDVHEIYKLVVHDLIGVDEAMSRLDAVVNRKPKYNRWIRVVTYGLAAVCVAPFAFEGRWIDMPIAFGKPPNPDPTSKRKG